MNYIRLITAIFFSVLFFNNSFALIALPSGECTDRTITAAITVQINCDDNDTLTVNSGVILDYDNNDVVGYVRSATYSPTFNQVIGIAMINKPYWHSKDQFKIEIDEKIFVGTICGLPFV